MKQSYRTVIVSTLATLLLSGVFAVRAGLEPNSPNDLPPVSTPTPTPTPEPTPTPTPKSTVKALPTPSYPAVITYHKFVGSKFSFEYPDGAGVPTETLIVYASKSYNIVQLKTPRVDTTNVLPKTAEEYITKKGTKQDKLAGYTKTTVSGFDAYRNKTSLETITMVGGTIIMITGRVGSNAVSYSSTETTDPYYSHLLQTITIK